MHKDFLNKNIGVILIALCLIAILVPQTIPAQPTYPDTLFVPVTFYDFHSDGSNPEFEKSPGISAGVHRGMVDSLLDADRKPKLGPIPYWNCCVAKWFRPWAPGDFTIPNYTSPPDTGCGNPASTVDYDTAFKNMVIQDTLKLRLVSRATGTYGGNYASFFPLDGEGFGNEKAAGSMRVHNYSFTMEMRLQFRKQANMRFAFNGGDDAWAFVDGKLRMDVGGIHNATTDSIIIDSIPGLDNGQVYTLDFFFCERHVTACDLQITTNLFSDQAIGTIIQSFSYKKTASGIKITKTGTSITALLPDYFKNKKLSVGLFSTAGKRMYSTTLPAYTSALKIPTSRLPNGMFIMAILGDGKKMTTSFVLANQAKE
jgi:fibro-slime domain-containing protein